MEHIKKPDWLKISIASNETFSKTKQIVESHHLHTICSSGKCPNMSECWGCGTATFMIGGNICTRCCKFCNTNTGVPLPLDEDEPIHIAQSIQLMKLKHAVITSVDRDDLPDYGSEHWTKTIHLIKELNPETTIEVLIPDFNGDEKCISLIIDEKPNIISHNIETVRRITPLVRSVAKYERSLEVLKQISSSGIKSKSGIMVGLGEKEAEVEETMDDLLMSGCSILTIGQYLQPSAKHYPVKEYINPNTFKKYHDIGLEKGFHIVESGPLVRSSYHAINHLS